MAPFISALLPRIRVPQVVVLIVGGVIVGPHVLDLASRPSLELIANVGLGFLFLLAGYELDVGLFGERGGRRAVVAWFVTACWPSWSPVSWRTSASSRRSSPWPSGSPPPRSARCSRSCGTTTCSAAGSGGSSCPRVRSASSCRSSAIAVFLSANGRFLGLVSLVAMFAVAGLVSLLPRLGFLSRFSAVARAGEDATSQTTLRLTVALLFALLVVASNFGLDVVLGAFLAGVVLRRWAPGNVHSLELKLDAVGYGFFIPVFFVTSGMGLDLPSIAENPLRLLVFFVLLLAVRGLPRCSSTGVTSCSTSGPQMALLTATALPLLVALSEIGLSTGHMLPENAAALVGAGVLSVIVFPGLAVALHRRDAGGGLATEHPAAGPARPTS